MFDVHYASLTSQGVQHRRFLQMATHPDINPVQQGLTSVNRREQVFPFSASRALNFGVCRVCNKMRGTDEGLLGRNAYPDEDEARKC